ncbi:MAG: type II toxin-antitoxin system VapC family toxin [Xanthobacteraceae bacterium]|nr:type II toxin-antitoxin system VapC family toxin [Xanthobacteraceae bacterium]
MRPLLLDTCAVIWIAEGDRLSEQSITVIGEAAASSTQTYVSPITAWEIGLLVARKRLQMTATPERWFADVLALPLMNLAPMPPELLVASSFLPGKPPRDPADRIVTATARSLGATLITRDRVLLDYGKQGHVSVVEC